MAQSGLDISRSYITKQGVVPTALGSGTDAFPPLKAVGYECRGYGAWDWRFKPHLPTAGRCGAPALGWSRRFANPQKPVPKFRQPVLFEEVCGV